MAFGHHNWTQTAANAQAHLLLGNVADFDEHDSGPEDGMVDDHVQNGLLLDSTQLVGRNSKKGGRPRDPVWQYFDSMSCYNNADASYLLQAVTEGTMASCQFCRWSIDKPKAFRMRAHIINCSASTQEAKDKMQVLEDHRASTTPKMKSSQAAFVAVPINGHLELIKCDSNDKKRKIEHTRQPTAGPSSLTRSSNHFGHRSAITCHVLDSMTGKPGGGMNCRLDRLTQNGFIMMHSATTDVDGRCEDLLPPASLLEAGIYKITFFTSEYYTARSVKTFYPFIEITFEVTDTEDRYHLALTLSPFSYSTYRGS